VCMCVCVCVCARARARAGAYKFRQIREGDEIPRWNEVTAALPSGGDPGWVLKSSY